MTRDIALEALYSRVPKIACKGLCIGSCGPIGYSEAERARLGHIGHDPIHMLCHKLDGMGRCTIYNRRPLICRLWGVAEEMPCPFGCVPERVLSAREGHDLLNAADDIAP